jgi:hypothetical protein
MVGDAYISACHTCPISTTHSETNVGECRSAVGKQPLVTQRPQKTDSLQLQPLDISPQQLQQHHSFVFWLVAGDEAGAEEMRKELLKQKAKLMAAMQRQGESCTQSPA